MATSAEARQSTQLAISETYFASPIQTLSESIKDPGQDWITTHDLVEAYNVLSTRIRSQVHDILRVDMPLPQLAIFKAQSSQIVECISRDLERLLPSPFESQHAGRSYYSDRSLSGDDLHIAINHATLCHHALRFMADIFTFQFLYTNFTNDQLSSLLYDALSLCQTPEIPLLNPGKIHAMVIWTLKVQQLPLPVLVREKRIITSTLQNVITLELGGDIVKLDALKAIHCILKQHPIFVDDFLVLLPLVLDHLTFGSLAIRCNAAMALSGFTLSKLHSPAISNYFRGRIFELVQTYIDGQTSRRDSLGTEIRLPAIFQAALAGEPFWEGKGPSFAISVTSCLIVLLDYSFYSSPRSLKFIFSVFARCSGHHHKFIRAIQPHMWKLAIWAFSRIPVTVTDDNDQTEISTFLDVRDRAYLVLRQDLRHGLGTTLVTTLLNAGEPEEDREGANNDVQKALECTTALVNSDDVSERTEGYAILCRFMSSIGATSTLLRSDDLGSTIAPSPALIDGSLLLGSSVGSITFPPQTSSIEQVRPLSEAEASIHWEELSKIWASLVQQFLSGSMLELSPDLVHIWQGLLLVQAQLTQEHLHLTSTSSFAGKVASIIAKFSTALEQPDTQSRYLSFVGKLWGVMKNVFESSWLCSPAEIILATLLEKQFSLSDVQVKDLWSQLCADLIAVGIPTVLHVLHVRSKSQEGLEVTRQLWLILANNSPLASIEEDWMSLLCFLVMPFSVWVMSNTEIEIWEAIFGRAIVIASRTAQTKDAVVSHFLKLLGEAKLVSLTQTPALLKTLLRVSSAEDSKLNTDLLASVDAVLVSSYCHSEEQVELGLDLLRFLGEVIPTIVESKLVQLLYSLQAGMIRWIVDEDTLLSDDEHKDLIIAIYCASLDKLALMEPSITILNAIAPFIQSVFVRIRGHGPLAFQTFWRATYHARLDIPKKDYPLLIQTCLKAWADFCEDSLADGISLDSESPSVTMPFIVPDSQSGELTSPGVGNSAFDLFGQLNMNNADVVNMGIERISDDSRSQGTITPIQQSSRQSFLDHSGDVSHSNPNPNPLGGRSFDAELQGPNNPGAPERHHSSDAVTISGIKRAADLDLRSTKRRKTDPETPKPQAGKGKGRASESDLYLLPDRRVSKLSVSEPVTRASPPLFAHTHSISQPSGSGRRTKKSRQSSSSRTEDKSASGSMSNRSDYVLRDSPVVEPIVISDDYDRWEQGVSADDLKQVQEALQNHSGLQSIVGAEVENDSAETMGDKEYILSPSLSEYPLRSRRRERSQTAPQLLNESSHQTMCPQPLRRNQTSPLHNKASSAQLDALQQAYAVITDMGTSQVDVQDLMQAKRLAHQISQVLDEQMCAKFGAQSNIQGGVG